MFQWSYKDAWFTYILWQDLKHKPFYVKDVANKNALKKHYKEALSWYYLYPKGITVFPYDDTQFILLTSMAWKIIIPNDNTLGKTIPNHNKFWEIIIPKHSTVWEKESLITSYDTGQAQ